MQSSEYELASHANRIWGILMHEFLLIFAAAYGGLYVIKANLYLQTSARMQKWMEDAADDGGMPDDLRKEFDRVLTVRRRLAVPIELAMGLIMVPYRLHGEGAKFFEPYTDEQVEELAEEDMHTIVALAMGRMQP